jgi:urease accessory protein UreE
MKIGLITYDRPHRKTQDIMLRLLGRNVTVIAIPFKERKRHEPLYHHRPQMDTGIDTKTSKEIRF